MLFCPRFRKSYFFSSPPCKNFCFAVPQLHRTDKTYSTASPKNSRYLDSAIHLTGICEVSQSCGFKIYYIDGGDIKDLRSYIAHGHTECHLFTSANQPSMCRRCIPASHKRLTFVTCWSACGAPENRTLDDLPSAPCESAILIVSRLAL